jgi:hypothetical protein
MPSNRWVVLALLFAVRVSTGIQYQAVAVRSSPFPGRRPTPSLPTHRGKVAAALTERAKAGDLFAKAPEIHKLEILAHKLPK